MTLLLNTDSEYNRWIIELSDRLKRCQFLAASKVNSQMLQFYWSLGRDIVELNVESRWGEKIFDILSQDFKEKFPELKGLSKRNLYYIKKFYLLYKPFFEIVPQAVAQLQSPHLLQDTKFPIELAKIFSIPWGHHRLIIDKFSLDVKKAMFFIDKTIENGWSRAMLLNFIDSNLYERQGSIVNNFEKSLPEPTSDLAQEVIKDSYNFDFLTLTQSYREKELKDALINNIQKFLLELGSGFAFMGREYRFQVGDTEQFIDLLFYNTKLHSYLVCEVKVVEFEPAHLGQLSSYVSCVNHILKTPSDNPTIGLLICKSKDNVFAQYSLEGYNQPIGISEFEGINFLPEDYKSSLPAIEDIEKIL